MFEQADVPSDSLFDADELTKVIVIKLLIAWKPELSIQRKLDADGVRKRHESWMIYCERIVADYWENEILSKVDLIDSKSRQDLTERQASILQAISYLGFPFDNPVEPERIYRNLCEIDVQPVLWRYADGTYRVLLTDNIPPSGSKTLLPI